MQQEMHTSIIVDFSCMFCPFIVAEWLIIWQVKDGIGMETTIFIYDDVLLKCRKNTEQHCYIWDT